MDLLKIVRKIPLAPPLFADEIFERLSRKVDKPQEVFPQAHFASAKTDTNRRRRPQAIAHRGFNAKFPENTLLAFSEAVRANADALETDVHLSKDGVVVLSHDPDLKRTLGVDKQIKQCDWEYLKGLKTRREPHEPLARLEDLLKLFRDPGWEHIWLLLDIKIDDDPPKLMSAVAGVFRRVELGNGRRWQDRVVLAYWSAQTLDLCGKLLPGFPVVNNGFSVPYSRQFLAVPNSGFDLLYPTLLNPMGRSFIKEAQKSNRLMLSWTVDDEKVMTWCVKNNLDGVVTNDIPKFLQISQSATPTGKDTTGGLWSLKNVIGFAYFNFWIMLFNLIYYKRHGSSSFHEGKGGSESPAAAGASDNSKKVS